MSTRRARIVLFAVFLLAAPRMLAVPAEPKPLHPPVPLLDADGASVKESGGPVSTMKTCGACHDTEYIAGHSFHVAAGSDERFSPGMNPRQRAWDWSPGMLGRWNPLGYRYLTPGGDRRLDLGTAEWLQVFAWRHVGGGPARTGQGTVPLETREPGGAADPDTHVIDSATGKPVAWDWKASGTVEMNCFLCHLPQPDNQARVRELAEGRFRWANTATLARTGLVKPSGQGWQVAPDALAADGTVDAARLGLRRPTAAHCGQCHGQVHRGGEPLVLEASLRNWSTATKGQVFSAQRMFESAVNLEDKGRLTRPWDVHAARLLECSSCHFSLNNPAQYEPTPRTRPAHLRFEPRRLATSEYLAQPSHQLAKGHTAQGTAAGHLAGTMRSCADCHDAGAAHDWLPYRQAHFRRLSCEACHAAEVHAPAVRQVDWTMLTAGGESLLEWRGVEGSPHDPAARVTGFRPVLLPHRDLEGRQKLVPYNLVSAWYWVEGGAVPRPVRLADLKAALLEGDRYRADVAASLDADGNGEIDAAERRLDTPEKVEAVRRRLEAVGVESPRIEAEVQPYGIHHGVGPAGWATRRCDTCHAKDSRLGERFELASYVPGGKLPKPVGDSDVTLAGRMAIERGELVLRPSTRAASLYVLGHNGWPWINVLGGLALTGVIVGVAVHTSLRLRTAWPDLFSRRFGRKTRPADGPEDPVPGAKEERP